MVFMTHKSNLIYTVWKKEKKNLRCNKMYIKMTVQENYKKIN